MKLKVDKIFSRKVIKMLWPTKILVPTDFSEYSDRTLRQARDIVKQYGSKVNVLHVVREEPPFVSEFGSVPGAAEWP